MKKKGVSCGPLKRWWHRRLRRLDEDTVLQAICANAPGDHRKAVQAIRVFVSLPGQEHWRCGCGASECERVTQNAMSPLGRAVYRASEGRVS